MTADMMIEANIALGVYLNNGVITSKAKNTISDITMLDTVVLHLAMLFTAVRAKPPAYGQC